MADLYVRGLSKEDIEALDKQVKKLKKETKEPWSRSKYVSMLINNAQKRATDIPVERNVEMLLKKQNEILTAHYAALNRILYLITNGDIPQGMNLLDKLSTPLRNEDSSTGDDE